MKLGRTGTIVAIAGAAVAAGAVAYYASGGTAKAATPPPSSKGSGGSGGGTKPTPTPTGSNPPTGALLLTDGAMTAVAGQFVWAPAGGTITSTVPTLGATALLDYGSTAVALGSTNQFSLVTVIWKDASGGPHVSAIAVINLNPAAQPTTPAGQAITTSTTALTLQTFTPPGVPLSIGQVYLPSGATYTNVTTTGAVTYVETGAASGSYGFVITGSGGTVTITWTPASGTSSIVTVITVP